MTTELSSDRKLGELFLHVARRTEGDDSYGSVKLYKTLFYADFEAYERLGRSITGAVYQRLPKGPAPKRALPVLRHLEEQRDADWAEREYHGLKQRKLIALREPDLSSFTGEEVALVDDVISRLWGLSARDVSLRSHRFTGWDVAQENEEIPYSTVMLAPPRAPTAREIEYGQRLASELDG